MAVPEELVWLIAQLRGTASRRERIRLLARAWRTLKDLNPTDRMAVAYELGFDGAEKLVEQLSRRGGASPAAVLELLERAEDAGPEQIVAMMQDLSDPEGRRSLGERFLSVAKNWVTDLESWEEAPEGPDLVDQASVEDVLEETAETEPEVTAPIDDSVVDLDLKEVLENAQGTDDAGDLRGLELGDAVVEVVGGDSETETEGPEPNSKEPVQRLEERLAAPGTPSVAPLPAPRSLPPERVRPAPRTADVEGLIRQLEECPSVTRRLREMSGMANDLVDADPNSLVSILDLFADGWVRRRALESLFRAGIPRSFEVAMSLAASLEDRAQRMWALSTLMATRELTPGEMEEVMSLPLSPVLRRRLARLGTVNPGIRVEG